MENQSIFGRPDNTAPSSSFANLYQRSDQSIVSRQDTVPLSDSSTTSIRRMPSVASLLRNKRPKPNHPDIADFVERSGEFLSRVAAGTYTEDGMKVVKEYGDQCNKVVRALTD